MFGEAYFEDVSIDEFAKLKNVYVFDDAFAGVSLLDHVSGSDAFEEEDELADGFGIGADVHPAMTGHSCEHADVLAAESVTVVLAVTCAMTAVVMTPL